MLLYLNKLKYAVICYRIAGDDERCENVARQGILICEDVLAGRIEGDEVEMQAWSGLAYEHIGDLRRIAKLDDQDAYQTAIQYYEKVEKAGAPHPVYAWANEEEFYQSSKFIAHLADAAGKLPDSDILTDLRSLSLTRRITYRQSAFDAILSQLDKGETLEWREGALADPDSDS